MNWEISLRDRIHDVVITHNNGLHIMKNAYKTMFKCHLVMLIYHSLYEMDINTSDFIESKEKRNEVLNEFKEMNEEKMTETIKSINDIEEYEDISTKCYLYALNVINNHVYEEMERLREFQDKHGLSRDEMNPNFVNDNLNRLINSEHVRFINENVNVLDF